MMAETGVDESNWRACCAFSTCVLIYALDVARRAPPWDVHRLLAEPLKTLQTTWTVGGMFLPTGVGSILVTVAADLHKKQQQQSQKQGDDEDDPERRMAEESLAHVDSLLHRMERYTNQTVSVHDDGFNAYQGAISRIMKGPLFQDDVDDQDCRLLAAAALRLWVRHIGVRPCKWVDIMFWPWFIPEPLFALLGERDPATLVIVVYWLVFVDRAPKKWFWEGWAQKAAAAALQYVGREWDDILAWPKAQLGFV